MQNFDEFLEAQGVDSECRAALLSLGCEQECQLLQYFPSAQHLEKFYLEEARVLLLFLSFLPLALSCLIYAQVARKGLIETVTTDNYLYSAGLVRLRGVWTTLQKNSTAEAGVIMSSQKKK